MSPRRVQAALAGVRRFESPEGFNLAEAEQFTKALDIPVICLGGFRSGPGMAAAIHEGRCDAVSMARAMIADPLIYQHLREGVQGPKCEWCNGCLARWGGKPIGCYGDEIRERRDLMLLQHAPE